MPFLPIDCVLLFFTYTLCSCPSSLRLPHIICIRHVLALYFRFPTFSYWALREIERL